MTPRDFGGLFPLNTRILCSGGTIALCDENGRYRILPTCNGINAENTATTPKSLILELRNLSLIPIGAEHKTHRLQIEGTMPPSWELQSNPNITGRVPYEKIDQMWRGISHAYAKRDELGPFLLAHQVANQLEICKWHVHEIAIAYNLYVAAHFKTNDNWTSSSAVGGYTLPIHRSVTSAFIALGTLRDFIAKFAAQVVFSLGDNVDDYKNLKPRLAKLDHPLAGHFHYCKNWLEELASVRNLLAHWSALEMVRESNYVHHHVLQVEEMELPQIVLHLPSDPKEMKSIDEIVKNYRTYSEFAKRKESDETSGPDALMYYYSNVMTMAELSSKVAHCSPRGPEVPVINADSVRGFEIIP